MGEVDGWDINKVVEFPELSLRSGAIQGWSCTQPYNFTLLQDLSKAKHISLDEPWEKLSPEAQEMVLYGTKDKISLTFCSPKGEKITREQPFEGIIPMSNRRFETTESSAVKAVLKNGVRFRLVLLVAAPDLMRLHAALTSVRESTKKPFRIFRRFRWTRQRLISERSSSKARLWISVKSSSTKSCFV